MNNPRMRQIPDYSISYKKGHYETSSKMAIKVNEVLRPRPRLLVIGFFGRILSKYYDDPDITPTNKFDCIY